MELFTNHDIYCHPQQDYPCTTHLYIPILLIVINIVWSSTYVTNLNRILLLQKRVVRTLTNSDYRAHSDPLFKQLKILDIFKLNTFHIGKFMFLYHQFRKFSLLTSLCFNFIIYVCNLISISFYMSVTETILY